MKLANNNEIIGKLESVKDCQDFLSLVLKMEVAVRIPNGAIPLDLLETLVNNKVGIINIDGRYCIRKLQDTKKETEISDLRYRKAVEEMDELFKKNGRVLHLR